MSDGLCFYNIVYNVVKLLQLLGLDYKRNPGKFQENWLVKRQKNVHFKSKQLLPFDNKNGNLQFVAIKIVAVRG